MSNGPASWAEYVRRRTWGLEREQVARKAGIHPSQMGRWMEGKGGVPKAESVIAFARSLGLPPKEALVAAGYLDPDEAGAVIEVMESSDDWPDEELLHQLAKRLAQRPSRPDVVDDITRRLSAVDDGGEGAEN